MIAKDESLQTLLNSVPIEELKERLSTVASNSSNVMELDRILGEMEKVAKEEMPILQQSLHKKRVELSAAMRGTFAKQLVQDLESKADVLAADPSEENLTLVTFLGAVAGKLHNTMQGNLSSPKKASRRRLQRLVQSFGDFGSKENSASVYKSSTAHNGTRMQLRKPPYVNDTAVLKAPDLSKNERFVKAAKAVSASKKAFPAPPTSGSKVGGAYAVSMPTVSVPQASRKRTSPSKNRISPGFKMNVPAAYGQTTPRRAAWDLKKP